MAFLNLTRFKHLMVLALLALVIYLAIDNRAWWSDLRHLSLSGFILLSILSVTLRLLGGFIYQKLYKALGLQLTLRESFALALGTSLGNYSPFIKGGAIFRSLYLKRRHGLLYSQFASSLGSLLLINLIVYSTIGILALGWLYFFKNAFSWVITLVLSFIFIGACGLYLLTAIFKGHRLLKIFYLDKILKTSKILHRNKNLFFGLSAAFVVTMILQATELYLAYSSLGYMVSFEYCIITIPFMLLVSFVGIAPGGIGLTETVIAFTSSTLGFGLQQGAVAAVLLRVVTLFWLLPLGGASIYFLSRKRGESCNISHKTN